MPEHPPRSRQPLGGSTKRKALLAVVFVSILITCIQLIRLWPGDTRSEDLSRRLGSPADLVNGTVVETERGVCQNSQPTDDIQCNLVRIKLTSGDQSGTTTTIEDPPDANTPAIVKGDKLVLGYAPDAPEGLKYYFADYQRQTPMLLLGFIFAVAVVALGRLSGLRALVGVVISLVVITKFVLPALLEGGNPVEIAATGAALLLFVSLYMAHGVNIRTTVAVVGTLVSLGLITTIGWAFTELAHFTGLTTEEAQFLSAFSAEVSVTGLLLAGLVIGALGVLDDVTVTQTSAVWELRQANQRYSPVQLYRSALKIGRDHIASTVNTLVLAYAGASLPLLIVFLEANRRFSDVLTSEVIAVEVVRTLVGSIGLVASVPITTALAAYVLHEEPIDSTAKTPS